MKKYKGAVFFDYDGTLTDEAHGISFPPENTVNSILKLRENGYCAMLATGRNMQYVPSGVSHLFDGSISGNGAVTVLDNEVLASYTFPTADTLNILNWLEERNIAYVAESNKGCYYFKEDDEVMSKALSMFYIDVTAFSKISEERKTQGNFTKLMIFFNTAEIRDECANLFDGKITLTSHRNSYSVDGNICNISKAMGIRTIIKALNLDIKDTYAFGDGDNDVEMLSLVGTGIAMADHHPSLDTVAKDITLSVTENGIGTALKKYNLI